MNDRRFHSSHWGAFTASVDGDRLSVSPRAGDPDPSGILRNLENAARNPARIARPVVRKGWLNKHGVATRRSGNDFVSLPWDEVLDILAAELARVKNEHGPQAVFGGSYGWASAGRFHHAQSQLHRFLNHALGGYVRSVNNYSAGAALVLLPHIMGPMEAVARRNVTWEQIEQHTDVVMAFGGMPLKNTAVASGGISAHIERGAMDAARKRGVRFILVSPLKDDLPQEAGAEWVALRPGTDTALMLAMAYVLATEGLHDKAFLERYCEGYEKFEPYLLGQVDGVPKMPAWASRITGLNAELIETLARSLVGRRTLIVTAQALQRAEYGEQPVWMAAVLAAMLGQFGLPGGGYNYGLGSLAHYGRRQTGVSLPALPQGTNAVRDFIPVARISDMLLNPGGKFSYDGQTLTYPNIRLVYWIGGNPFHHHQDLNRLRAAFDRVETIVVHETAWTPMARHADIVLPATMTVERNDIAGGPTDPVLLAMHKLMEPYELSRDDYSIFASLAERLGAAQSFTEGRTAEEWLRHMYGSLEDSLKTTGHEIPDFDAFWERGEIDLPQEPDDGGILRSFRADPVGSPLPTPSGKIEIYSDKIGSFGYADCGAHPKWFEHSDLPRETGEFVLVSNQPSRRLHSQLDFGNFSVEGKIHGREPVRVSTEDAARLGLSDGDIVRLYNDRGACLAAVKVSDAVRPGVLNLSTGAWYDPYEPTGDAPVCVHGNPNVLTRDVGTSSLAQGCTGQLTTVRIERFEGELPPVRAFDPPATA
ncbi:MAG: molybdopterin-dependent oxidoreductase [Rhizobiaceae bacterium]|nr:molybdopterin-dependent oxidoreductase [Rhizobiaceae bacterium]